MNVKIVLVIMIIKIINLFIVNNQYNLSPEEIIFGYLNKVNFQYFIEQEFNLLFMFYHDPIYFIFFY